MDKEHSLQNEFDYQGFWWFPKNPTLRFAGNLTYKVQQPINLELLVSIDDYYLYFESAFEAEIIQGHTLEGGKITLQTCRMHGNRSFNNELNVASVNYTSKYVFVGECYDTIDAIQFESLSVNYTNLEPWMRILPPLDIKEMRTDQNRIYEASYVQPEPIEIHISSIDTKILLGLGLVGISSYPIEIKWKQGAFVEITPSVPQTFSWFMEQSEKIRNLLAFLMGLPVYRTELTGISDKVVHIYYHARLPQDLNSAGSNLVMPFAVEYLGPFTLPVFQLWFDNQASILPLSNLALGVLYNDHRFLEFEYLALIQAVESYHRKKTGKDITLKARLKELYHALPGELQVEVGFGETYIASIVKTRNYYTHYNDKDKKDAFTGEQLYDAIRRLIALVNILIFKEQLKLSDNLIKDAFIRCRGYGLWWRK